MGRFTNPRDLYFGEGARHEVKNLKGKKAIIVSGGSSMRRGGFLQDVEADLKEAGMEASSTRWPTSTSPLMSPSSTPSSPTPCPPSCALTPAWML